MSEETSSNMEQEAQVQIKRFDIFERTLLTPVIENLAILVAFQAGMAWYTVLGLYVAFQLLPVIRKRRSLNVHTILRSVPIGLVIALYTIFPNMLGYFLGIIVHGGWNALRLRFFSSGVVHELSQWKTIQEKDKDVSWRFSIGELLGALLAAPLVENLIIVALLLGGANAYLVLITFAGVHMLWTSKKERKLSVTPLFGTAIPAMIIIYIFVNNPTFWGYFAGVLVHAGWNGVALLLVYLLLKSKENQSKQAESDTI